MIKQHGESVDLVREIDSTQMLWHETDLATGLSHAQVKERQEQGLVNQVKRKTSRSIWSIARSNIFTLFNAILTAAMLVVLIVGSPVDALFAIVMVVNSLTGIVAELKAKHTLDKVAILASPTARVMRSECEIEITRAEVLLGDVVCLSLGDQVPTDGTVVSSIGLAVDESLLTGESVPVSKTVGDQILAGTTVVSGVGNYLAKAVADHVYSERLASEVKKFSQSHSELKAGVNRVLAWISWAIVPIVGLLLYSQLRISAEVNFADALILSVAGVVGMIPQGLVLLTSVNFAIAAATLARKSVLVQELPAVEILARVDTLCTDKTGTLTSGKVSTREIRVLSEVFDGNLPVTADEFHALAHQALATLVSGGENDTAQAIKTTLEGIVKLNPKSEVPFNSARKWSGLTTVQGAWVLGAPEIILATSGDHKSALEQVSAGADQGERVLCLAWSKQNYLYDELPSQLWPVLLIFLEEELRADAADTMAYFRSQDVDLKVVSGDNPRTVAALAKRAGIASTTITEVEAIDARLLPAVERSEEFTEAVMRYSIFGRVTPEQKRALVQALQSRGRTVAMTGDGVNDAMAVKDADLGIAMGSGSAATKAAAQIVLLNGDFSALPPVLAEGRRIMANMERVASLFFAKTTYAAVIAVFVAVLGWSYPFLPRHLTIVGSLTIGIPAFVVALAPNAQKYRSGFLKRSLSLAVPAGLILAVAALAGYAFNPGGQGSTVATVIIVSGALYFLAVLLRPMLWWQRILLSSMAAIVVAILTISGLRHFMQLVWPTGVGWLTILISVIAAVTCLEMLQYWRTILSKQTPTNQ